MNDLAQGTLAWLQARAGHVTASRFSDVLAKIKVGESKERQKYRWELVTERLTGIACEQYSNKAMEWGTQHEPDARLAYEVQSGNVVQEVGLVLHPVVPWTGCSPDGLVGKDGGVEIKCPYNSVVHVQTLSDGAMPSEHRAQVQGSLWVTGREYWDFVSFDPRMPEKLQLFVCRVRRDEDYIRALNEEVHKFLDEVDKLHQQLLRMAA